MLTESLTQGSALYCELELIFGCTIPHALTSMHLFYFIFIN